MKKISSKKKFSKKKFLLTQNFFMLKWHTMSIHISLHSSIYISSANISPVCLP